MLKQLFIIVILVSYLTSNSYAASNDNQLAFDDSPLAVQLNLPDWFKLSFLDLQDSLDEANSNGRGLIIYFERKNCAYCKAQLDINWGTVDIIDYTKKNFDVIAIDVKGQKTVTDFNGDTYNEHDYAVKMKTDFTPSFLFFDKNGHFSLQLYGYRPPYQFRAALEFVADDHYHKEALSSYMSRAEHAMSFGQDELNDNDVFELKQNTTKLNRLKKSDSRLLAVFFEHPKCHACDILHAGPMNEVEIINQLKKMRVVQIDNTLNDLVITPSGIKTTNKAWAETLNLSFAPAIIFFDENGHQIFRIESVVRFNRLKNVLQYMLKGGYKTYPTFQLWREKSHE